MESLKAEESICNKTFIDVLVIVLQQDRLLPLAGLPAALPCQQQLSPC